MVYHGTYRDGKIELDGDAALPEGVRVRVEAEDATASARHPRDDEETLTSGQRMLKVSGIGGREAPTDLAAQVDHYLYGTPKR